MTLLIDNYDSFSYNLVQMIGSINADIRIVRNDKVTIEELEEMAPSRVVLSPGPGHPRDAGILEAAILALKGKMPILGVCLGHQGICEAFGGTICSAKEQMHGKQSEIEIDGQSPIFKNLPTRIQAARYHSLGAEEENLPQELKIIARDKKNGEIMALQHRKYPIFGLQFHPESILTPEGRKIIENFLALGN